jgi:hypothetical protein
MARAGYIQLGTKRDYASGSLCSRAEVGWARETSPAKSETLDVTLMVPDPMLLTVPGGGGRTTPDGKSLIIKNTNKKVETWTWTYTPTPVK